MASARISLFHGLSILFSCLVLGHAAIAADASDFDPQALAQVLDQADYVVRGRAISSRADTTRSGERYQYVNFKVTEVLKGSVPGTEILVRQPAPPEGSDSDGTTEDDENGVTDTIFALGARDPADGSYSAAPGFASGEYRVESDQDGDWVLVNGFGVDADSVSPKDVHRKIANARVPIEVFRRIAQGHGPAKPPPSADAAERVQPDPASIQLPSADPKSSRMPQALPSPPIESGSDRGRLRMAIAAALAAIAIAAWFLLKRSSTSRRK